MEDNQLKKEPILNDKAIIQVGMIVKDIEETSRAYAEFFNVDVPEIVWTGEFKDANQHYKGEPVESRAKQSFFDMGSVQLELIEPDNGPSTWRDHLVKHGEGVHHIAFMVDGMKNTVARFESHDMPLIQKGEYTGGRYAYLDTFDKLKLVVELLEND